MEDSRQWLFSVQPTLYGDVLSIMWLITAKSLPYFTAVECRPCSRQKMPCTENTMLNKKASIRWQDSAPPISGYWPTSEPNAGKWRNDVTAAALWGEVCATQVLPMRVGPFAFRYQVKGATLCQYVDTTRKAIDCATTLPLTVVIWWKFAADFSSFIVKIVQKTTNLGTLSPFWGS